MMTLKEWRDGKKWSQAHLASALTKRLGRTIYQSHVAAWEGGAMPAADVGEALRTLSCGKVRADGLGRKEAARYARKP
jgi:hypothetical protein